MSSGTTLLPHLRQTHLWASASLWNIPQLLQNLILVITLVFHGT